MRVFRRIKRRYAAATTICVGTMLVCTAFLSPEPAAKSSDKAAILRQLLPNSEGAVLRRHLPKSRVTNASNVVVGQAGKPLMALSTTLVEPKANATVEWTLDTVPASKECRKEPKHLKGELFTYKDAPHFEEMMARLRPGLEPGGHYRPPTCRSRHRVAIIIPYRDRQNHLHVLLSNLHPMLMRQELDYFILVVELAMPTEFNRGLLLNIGAVEALGLWDVDCFIFHDVDLIPLNDRNLYTCPERFRHMSAAIDKFYFRPIKEKIEGGVSAMDKNYFYQLNGFSNIFFGWGGEDTDFYYRLKAARMSVNRPPMDKARYWMFRHPVDNANPVNPERFRVLRSRRRRQPTDGLNSLKYEVVDVQFRTAYTWLLVSLDKEAYL